MEIVEQNHTACGSVQFVIRGGNSSVRMERSKYYIIIFKKGSRNKTAKYRPVSLTIKDTKEKNLGLINSAFMKVSDQCGIAAANGKQIIGL